MTLLFTLMLPFPITYTEGEAGEASVMGTVNEPEVSFSAGVGGPPRRFLPGDGRWNTEESTTAFD